MTISQKVCYVLTCDECGDGWTDHDDYGTPHFDTVDEAIEYVTGGEDGWVVAGHDRAVCPRCARKADCAATGHQWDGWDDRTSPNGVPFRLRWCQHCNSHDFDPPFDEVKTLDRLAADPPA